VLRDEAIGESRKLRNEELIDLWSPDFIRVIQSRRMGFAGHVACMGERRDAYRALVRKREGKRLLGNPRRKLDDIKFDFQKVD